MLKELSGDNFLFHPLQSSKGNKNWVIRDSPWVELLREPDGCRQAVFVWGGKLWRRYCLSSGANWVRDDNWIEGRKRRLHTSCLFTVWLSNTLIAAVLTRGWPHSGDWWTLGCAGMAVHCGHKTSERAGYSDGPLAEIRKKLLHKVFESGERLRNIIMLQASGNRLTPKAKNLRK